MLSKMNREDIAQELQAYCERYDSQNRAAQSIGVAAATVSAIVNRDWEKVSDKMFITIADSIGYEWQEWQAIDTRPYKAFTTMLEDAQHDSLCMAVTSDAGSGKTFTCKQYVKAHQNAYHVSCKNYWSKKDFLVAVGKEVGNPTSGRRITDLVDDIISTLRRDESPLLILDEADKLGDPVLQLFITLYNDLEGKCGIVLCATDHLESHIRKGVVLGHTGFNEIISRIGRKFVALPAVDQKDVTKICEANGITEPEAISDIMIGAAYEGKTKGKTAMYDLRRVRRKIDALNLKRK